MPEKPDLAQTNSQNELVRESEEYELEEDECGDLRARSDASLDLQIFQAGKGANSLTLPVNQALRRPLDG
ncbi:hypothetical protein Tco_0286448 [Tanacetum coccineum]